jgi:hypothetical protein
MSGLNGGLGQSQVYYQPVPGIAGDFASANTNRFTVLAGPGGLVAGPSGVSVGLFAWTLANYLDTDGSPEIVNNYGSGLVAGFVHREQQGLITFYLQDTTMVVPPGFPVTLFDSGDFWVLNNGATQAIPGQKAYANFTTGQVTFAATGAPTTASATASTIAAGTAATFSGSIAGNVLTTSGAVTNTIYPGAVLSGGTVASGTTIVSQLSGTTGGAGTYAVSIAEQTVASASLTATPYVLDTTGGSVTGTIVLGSTVQSAAGTPTGTVVGAGVTVLNTPATGKYIVSTGGATVTSGTIVLASNVETKWYARSSGLPGEVVKMSSTPLG